MRLSAEAPLFHEGGLIFNQQPVGIVIPLAISPKRFILILSISREEAPK